MSRSHWPIHHPQNDYTYEQSPRQRSSPYPHYGGSYTSQEHNSYQYHSQGCNDPRSTASQRSSSPAPTFPGAFGSYSDPTLAPVDLSPLDISRSPSPKYVGRRERNASKGGSVSSSGPTNTRTRQRKKTVTRPPGYKSPTCETAPNSPLLVPSLASDAETILVENEDYVWVPPVERPRPSFRPQVSEETVKALGRAPSPTGALGIPERQRAPYSGSSAASSTTSESTSSSPSDTVFLERDRRRYNAPRQDSFLARQGSFPVETAPRTSQPYSYVPSETTSNASRRTGYASSGSQLEHSREDLRPPNPISGLPRKSPSACSGRSHYSDTASSRTRQPSPPPTHDQSLIARTPSPEPAPAEFLELVPSCPKRSLVNRGHWYKHPAAPGFNVCERCYEVHIYNTVFKDDFDVVELGRDQIAYCAFNTPRILNQVWPEAQETRSLDTFINYARMRSGITNCTQASSSPVGIWYTMDGIRSHGGLISCPACYEDVVLASPYIEHFHRLEAMNPTGIMSCHISTTPFLEAQLVQSDLPWSQLLSDVEYRMREVEPCPKKVPVPDIKRRWWKPKRTELPIRICDACYCDGVFPSPLADEFVDIYPSSPQEEWFCTMGAFNLNVVWNLAAEKDEYRLWLDAANAAWSPECTHRGTKGGEYWAIKQESLEGFDICDRCMRTYFEPLGFAKHLVKMSYPSDLRIWCGLSTSNHDETLAVLADAALWRDFDTFLAYIAPRIGADPCPGQDRVYREKWWGNKDFRICEECWKFCVRNSRLRDFIAEIKPRGRSKKTCDLGTPETKGLWRLYNQKNDFRGFVGVMNLQLEVQEIRRKRQRIEKEINTLARRGTYDDRRRPERNLRELADEEDALVQRLQSLTMI